MIDSKANHVSHQMEEVGSFNFEMKLFENSAFEKEVDNLSVTIPEHVNIAVSVKSSELHAKSYKTVIESCWATPR